MIGEASETRHGAWQWALVLIPGGLIALGLWRAWKVRRARHEVVQQYLDDPRRP